MAIKKSAFRKSDPEEIECPNCGGSNVEFDVAGGIYKMYCEDCKQVTHEGKLVPGNPVRDYRETPRTGFGDLLEREHNRSELPSGLRDTMNREKSRVRCSQCGGIGGIHCFACPNELCECGAKRGEHLNNGCGIQSGCKSSNCKEFRG